MALDRGTPATDRHPQFDHLPQIPTGSLWRSENPIGWYPDPWMRNEQRFFNESGWTYSVRNGGVMGVDRKGR